MNEYQEEQLIKTISEIKNCLGSIYDEIRSLRSDIKKFSTEKTKLLAAQNKTIEEIKKKIN